MRISNLVIEQGDIKLRKISLEDKKEMFEYCSQDNVGPNAGWNKHTDITETVKVIETFLKSQDVLGIEYKGKLIGSIGLHGDEKVTIGYVLNENYWGNGITTNAVKMLLDRVNLDKYYINIDKNNIRSQKVANKLLDMGYNIEINIKD